MAGGAGAGEDGVAALLIPFAGGQDLADAGDRVGLFLLARRDERSPVLRNGLVQFRVVEQEDSPDLLGRDEAGPDVPFRNGVDQCLGHIGAIRHHRRQIADNRGQRDQPG